MGKNRDRKSLIRLMVNVIVHEIVIRNTNRFESKNFLGSEIIEYRGQTEKVLEKHVWDDNDLEYIREKALNNIKEKLKSKYSDINYNQNDIQKLLDKEIKNLGFNKNEV